MIKDALQKFLIASTVLTVTLALAGAEIYKNGQCQLSASSYLFGDNVNVRKSPSTKGQVVDTLAIGTKIIIEAKSEEVLSVKGYEDNWYEVSYTAKGKEKSAFVWGGLIAKAYLLEGKKLFLLGISNKENGFQAECRMVEKNKLISSVGFDPHSFDVGSEPRHYGYTISSTLHGNKGLAKLSGVLEFYFEYEACGYPIGSAWIGYTDKKMVYLLSDNSVSEAGLFHYEESVSFPKDKGGEKNTIVVKGQPSTYVEDKGDYVPEKALLTKYVWDGKALVKKE